MCERGFLPCRRSYRGWLGLARRQAGPASPAHNNISFVLQLAVISGGLINGVWLIALARSPAPLAQVEAGESAGHGTSTHRMFYIQGERLRCISGVA